MKKFISLISMLALAAVFTLGTATVQAATTTPQTSTTGDVGATNTGKIVHHMGKKHAKRHGHKAHKTNTTTTPAK